MEISSSATVGFREAVDGVLGVFVDVGEVRGTVIGILPVFDDVVESVDDLCDRSRLLV